MTDEANAGAGEANEGTGGGVEEASTDFGGHGDDLTDTTVPENPTEDGTAEAGTRLDDPLAALADDELADDAMSKQTVTNDAVAGHTVFPGAGIGNDGPTGGSPGEAEPTYDEHGDAEDIVLADNSSDAARPSDDDAQRQARDR